MPSDKRVAKTPAPRYEFLKADTPCPSPAGHPITRKVHASVLKTYHGKIRNIVFLFAHCGLAEEGGNRIYEVAASVFAPDRPEEKFSSRVRYGRSTEREHHVSGISRETLRSAPTLADVAAFLSPLLSGADTVLTLNPREQIETLLAAGGNPRVIDLRFVAEFFLPQVDSSAMKPLWERLHGRKRDKFSFSAPEVVELSVELVRQIETRVLNPAEFPPAASLRFHLERSETLFGDLFLHLNRNFRDYFGGLFDPSAGLDTSDWKRFLAKGPLPAHPPEGDEPVKKIRVARMGDLFGSLAASARGYALRPSQNAYAGLVAGALNDGAVLAVEAGTGTGKTQGYLIPVFEHLRLNPRERVAVSTFTKNLQDQIIRREIPLAASLNRAYRRIPCALLKGKSNYICAEKLENLYEDGLSGTRLIAWLYFVIRLLHFRLVDGDGVGERVRFHLDDGPVFRRLRHEISARSGCPPRHLRCPAQVVAAEARNARLIVTNHHKLALLDRDETLGGSFGTYVIDEANHFEGAVRGAFAVEISSRDIADTVSYLESALRRLRSDASGFDASGITTALDAIASFRSEASDLAQALAAVRGTSAPGESSVLDAVHPAFRDGSLKRHLADLRNSLKGITGNLSFVKEPMTGRKLGLHARTLDRMKTALGDLRENAATLKAIGEKIGSATDVAACILFQRHWVISVRPVEVADLLRDHLYSSRRCVIFTSATLRHNGSFDGFRASVGMDAPGETETAETRLLSALPSQGLDQPNSVGQSPDHEFRFAAIPSPFDPAAAEIAVPERAVSGAFENKDAWLTRVCELLPVLVRSNRGRTLVLFSSYADMNAVSGRVADRIRADGFPLIIQQNGVPTSVLCDEFRAIRESVLFGVDTFWYGVDFPGDTLTQVVITRIPFPHPQDPLQIARRNLLPRKDYWRRYRYETEIKLRQGIGRLIRSESDRGRVVILDARYPNFNGRKEPS